MAAASLRDARKGLTKLMRDTGRADLDGSGNVAMVKTQLHQRLNEIKERVDEAREVIDSPYQAPKDPGETRVLCRKFMRNPRDELFLLELIASLPIYDKIAYDTVLEKPVIRLPGKKTWQLLNKETLTAVRTALVKQLKAYAEELDDDDDEEKVKDEVRRIERYDNDDRNNTLLMAMPNIVRSKETKKRASCAVFLDGWMLCADDVLVRLDIDKSSGLLVVDSRTCAFVFRATTLSGQSNLAAAARRSRGNSSTSSAMPGTTTAPFAISTLSWPTPSG